MTMVVSFGLKIKLTSTTFYHEQAKDRTLLDFRYMRALSQQERFDKLLRTITDCSLVFVLDARCLSTQYFNFALLIASMTSSLSTHVSPSE